MKWMNFDWEKIHLIRVNKWKYKLWYVKMTENQPKTKHEARLTIGKVQQNTLIKYKIVEN